MKRKQTDKRVLIFDKEGITAFSVQLKKLRQEAGMTQSQLAYEAGISLSQIARIETAQINPTLSTILAIARALEIPLTTLFDFPLPKIQE